VGTIARKENPDAWTRIGPYKALCGLWLSGASGASLWLPKPANGNTLQTHKSIMYAVTVTVRVTEMFSTEFEDGHLTPHGGFQR
jgi:hypothetical protein